MLYLDAPIGPINGLMVYRDHQDKDLFYYVPERPRLARNNGVPEFVFLKYKRDITDNPDFDADTKQSLGGGFMAFTVDLGVSDEELDDIKGELSEYAEGSVKLAPVQFRKGSVRLSISKDAADAPDAQPNEPRGLTFFEEVYGTSKPSLFGFNRATFSLVLSQEAATLFESALRSGISPIGVIYDLEFLGLRPAFHVHITADYRRVYSHLEAEFGVRGQIGPVSLAADIGLAFQKLRDEGVIKVEVQNFTDDKDLRKQADDAFDWFKKDLLKDFFKSSLEPPSFMNRTASEGLLGQFQNLFKGLNSTQSSSFRPETGRPSSEAPTTAPRASDLSSGERSTSEDNRSVAAASGGDGGGGGGRPSGGDSSVSPFQVAFSLKFYKQEELKKREFDYSMQAAVARESAPQGLFSTIIEGLDLTKTIKEVNLDDDFFKRLVATVSMGGDLNVAKISTVAVNLEYPGERASGEEPIHVDGFLFKPEDLAAKTFTTWLNESKDLDYRYQMDIHFMPDSPWVGKEVHVTSGWNVTRERQLTVDPLDEVGLFAIDLSFGDISSGQVAQAQVEMHYEDAANDFKTQKTFLLKPGQPGAQWKLRLSNPDLKTYRYRIVYFLQENLRIETDWMTSEDPSLIINEPFKGTLNVRLVPLLRAEDIVEAVVDLTYTEEETGYTHRLQKLFTPPDQLRSQTVSVPTLVEDPGKYGYEITVVRMDGSVYTSGPMTSDDAVLVISDGAGTTHRINVKLVGDMGAAGLSYVKVDLTGPGESPDFESALFRVSDTGDKTVSLVQPDDGGAFKYGYKITGYTLQGAVVEGESGDSTDRTLMARVPG